MSLGILNKINYGYEELEPVIVGLFAMNRNFLLIGRHGTGKTRMARALAKGFGRDGFVFYDATKDDLISIAGIPDPKAIQHGHLVFTPHQRSIWDKSTIVVDEITRAGKENQNLWLEILEERTCFGVPLSYRTLIATANPASYAAAFRLDDALLDRFYAVVPVPEHQVGMDAEDLGGMLELAFSPASPLDSEELARTFAEIQGVYHRLYQGAERERVIEYAAQVFQQILTLEQEKEGDPLFISPRTMSRLFPQTLLSIAAYHTVAGRDNPLVTAGWDALKYAVVTKVGLQESAILQLHKTYAGILESLEISEGDKLRLELGSLKTFEERIAYLKDHAQRLQADLKLDELERFLGELMRGATQAGEKEKLVTLHGVLSEMGYTGDLFRQINGNLILTINSAVGEFMPRLAELELGQGEKNSAARGNVEIFKTMVREGLLINAVDPATQELKRFLIDLMEGDRDAEPNAIVEFLNTIELPQPAVAEG